MSKNFFIKTIKINNDYELKIDGKEYLVKGSTLINLYKKHILDEFERKINEKYIKK